MVRKATLITTATILILSLPHCASAAVTVSKRVWTEQAAKGRIGSLVVTSSGKWQKASPWPPDADTLLGPYEATALERRTSATFLTHNNSAVTVQVGGTAALRCQVFNVAEHETVSWIRHRDHHLLSLGSLTHTSDDRFQATYDQELQDWTLHIHYAQPRDAGIYECQLSTHPPIGVLTTLTVAEPVATIAGGPDMFIQVGSGVHLRCTIAQYTEPPTYVFWYHGAKMINYDTERQLRVLFDGAGASELHIAQAEAQDSGNYSCAPSNTRPAHAMLHVLPGEAPAAMQSLACSTRLPSFSVVVLLPTLVIVMLLSSRQFDT